MRRGDRDELCERKERAPRKGEICQINFLSLPRPLKFQINREFQLIIILIGERKSCSFLPSPNTPFITILFFLHCVWESGIKFIMPFMKPIMKARLMVVERTSEVELIAFRTFVAWWVNEKPDRTTTRAPTWVSPEKLVSLRMFRRCFQFKFNIRFVQFTKVTSFRFVNIFFCVFLLISQKRFAPLSSLSLIAHCFTWREKSGSN